MTKEHEAYEYNLCLALAKADGLTEVDWHATTVEAAKFREDTRRRVKHLLPIVGLIDPMYDVPGVAKIMSMSTWTIRRWIEEGKLRGTKINGYWRIPRSEILRISKDLHGD